MSKKIEPGCLVVVISGKHVGTSGIAEKIVKNGDIVYNTVAKIGQDCWLVDINEDDAGIFAPHRLLRIDDYDASQDEVKEDMTATQ